MYNNNVVLNCDKENRGLSGFRNTETPYLTVSYGNEALHGGRASTRMCHIKLVGGEVWPPCRATSEADSYSGYFAHIMSEICTG